MGRPGEPRTLNYYRRYLGDYMRDTMHLSITEHGAYGLLLDACYATEKPLPKDYEALYRICRAMNASEQAAVRVVADQFFVIGDDGLRHNDRAEREIGVAQSTIERQRASGLDSSVKRWGKDKSTDKSTEESTDGESIQPPTTNHQPSSSNHQKISRRGTRLPDDWALPSEWQLWALKEESTWTPTYCRKAAEEFHRYWIAIPGQRGVKLNWYATWQNRVKTLGPMPKNGVKGEPARPWFLTASGIEEKGRARGFVVPTEKKEWPAFRAAVYKAEGVTEEMLKRAQGDL